VINVIERVLAIYGRVNKRSKTAGDFPAYKLRSDQVAIDYTVGLADKHDWFYGDIRRAGVWKFTYPYLPIICATELYGLFQTCRIGVYSVIGV
jgi:hypothetical protein